jgi:hypothetical protein
VTPDNYDAYIAHENEQERLKRIQIKKEVEEIRLEDLPFYYDHITIREVFGKGLKPCQHYMN